MTRIQVNLHHIYKNSRAIEDALQAAFDEAMEKKVREVEILSGNNHAQLLKKAERFLQQPAIKKYYQRMENDSKGLGKLVLYFKF
ncbi:MAG: Smr/MutS family protein [Bacteroidota bacterium]|nr:Smr/MutS family protein [Bacteroidota bacterium]